MWIPATLVKPLLRLVAAPVVVRLVMTLLETTQPVAVAEEEVVVYIPRTKPPVPVP